MRNDARPIGSDIGHDQSPVPSHPPTEDSPATTDAGDARDSVTHGRQSHVVNRPAEDEARRTDADVDPVMPTGDSTLKTRI